MSSDMEGTGSSLASEEKTVAVFACRVPLVASLLQSAVETNQILSFLQRMSLHMQPENSLFK